MRLVIVGLIGWSVFGADLKKGLDAFHRGDCKQAYTEMKPLADLGNPSAENNIGALYTRGCGVPRDEAKGCRWYQRSIEHGAYQAVILNNMGFCYYKGTGVPQDYVSAEMWFIRAGPGTDDADRSARESTASHLTEEQLKTAQQMAGYSASQIFQHKVARLGTIIAEKVLIKNGVMVYASMWHDGSRVSSTVGVWNMNDHGEVPVNPKTIFLKVPDAHGQRQIYAKAPERIVSTGRTSSYLTAGIVGMRSTKRTASVMATDIGTGGTIIGSVTYSDPELERQRRDAMQTIMDQQAAAKAQRAQMVLWPVVLKPAEYMSGLVLFANAPKIFSDSLLCVPIEGVMYEIPFHFVAKRDAGK